MSAAPALTLVAAVGQNGVIGGDNRLLWRLPEDMAHFKALTAGQTVVMGRKTWESLPPRFRPLPGRRNIVVTRQKDYRADGAEAASGLPQALALAAAGQGRVFIIGGGELYAQTLPLADRLVLTEVALSPPGDAFFPPLTPGQWRETARQPGVSENGVAYAFVTYERTQST